MMKLLTYIISFFILITINCYSETIDSTSFDINILYSKIGNKSYFRIIQASTKSKFLLIKAKDSLYYILKPEKAHGPFYECKSLNNGNLFWLTESKTLKEFIYSTASEKTIEIDADKGYYHDYRFPEKASTFYQKNGKFYILQNNEHEYGPFKLIPHILYSSGDKTYYQIYKNNIDFELFENDLSLGTYSLMEDRYKNRFSDYAGTDVTIFKNKKHEFYFDDGKLCGPYKKVKKQYIIPRYGNGYGCYKYLHQKAGDDFYTLDWKDTLLHLSLETEFTYSTFQLCPDSSITTLATNLKKYRFLKDEPELYFFNTKNGLIEPFPIEKAYLHLQNNPYFDFLSKNFFLYKNQYISGREHYSFYLFYKSKYIDSLSIEQAKTLTIINDNVFYKKNNKDYINGKELKLPENTTACIFKNDTFYVIKTGPTTWQLYKNRKLQQTQPVSVIDNIYKFVFQYSRKDQKLFLELYTGLGDDFYRNTCPNGCYIIPFDVADGKKSTTIRYDNFERQEDLYSTTTPTLNIWEGKKENPSSFTVKKNKYKYNWMLVDDNYSYLTVAYFANITNDSIKLYYYENILYK